jgi:hypothetical protein
MTESTALAAFVDGDEVGEDEARALWKEFSEHMDAHQGDFAGYAKKKGWATVMPEYRAGRAVLVVRTTPSAPGLPPVAPKAKAPAPAAAMPARRGGKKGGPKPRR